MPPMQGIDLIFALFASIILILMLLRRGAGWWLLIIVGVLWVVVSESVWG